MWRDRVLRGDQRLQEVRRAGRGGVWGQQLECLRDLDVVPAGAVLVREQHQPPVPHPGVPAGVLEQHQGEQRVELDAAGQQLA